MNSFSSKEKLYITNLIWPPTILVQVPPLRIHTS